MVGSGLFDVLLVGFGELLPGSGEVCEGDTGVDGEVEAEEVDDGELLRVGACEGPMSASERSNSPVSTPLSAASVYAFQISAGKLEPPARPPPAVPVRVTCLAVPGSSPNIATTVTSSGVYAVNQAATLDSVVPVLPAAS